jgi:hydroxymethylpyrimidine kinase / phosphomethylpyrimidine kinase / thiamine-phosphate diphosphorylase
MAMTIALTIAGSDSGGGAGIQADLKTFAALGVYGASVITSVTAQNTLEVTGIHDLPAEFVVLQLDTVVRDLPVDAIKTGMLSNPAIIRAVGERLNALGIGRLVVDPVMVAKGGAALLRKEAEAELIQGLLPLASVVTPNLGEAEVLAAMPIRNLSDMEQAARRIYEQGPRNVVVKGGHLEGPPVDVLFDGRTFQYFEGERIETKSLHGTGCTFASAIAAELAKGAEVVDAVRSAKAFITEAIRLAEPIGHGFGPTHHLGALYTQAARYDVLLQLEEAMARLQEGRIAVLLPQGESNLGMALPHAATPQEVAAWAGQIVRAGVDVCPMGSLRFGASQHIAAVILTAMRSDPTYRSAMTIRYGQEVLRACQNSNLRIAQFARQEAPSEVRQDENLTLAWGVAGAIQQRGAVPDIICDRGDVNQDAVVRVLGRDALDVASKVLLIRHHLSPQ